ncbi:Uncharacterised protein [uncultured archaeon]|nr:Uncharacterised protein [uncultured archaeon]
MWEENFKTYLYQRVETASVDKEQLAAMIDLTEKDMQSLFEKLTGRKAATEADKKIFDDIVRIALSGLQSISGRNVDEVIAESYDIGVRKNTDYGSGNILKFGVIGLIVRETDKMERIKNLLKNEASFKKETVEDTLMDMINYAVYGKMLLDGVWF